jgi:quinol monooxygenase YgiN
MLVIPYPDNWLSHKPIPEMKDKCLGIFAHVFVKNGEQESIKNIYRNIVDVAIEEETCIVLSGNQSLVQPNHNLLYEEWTDYDEFFQVQMSRTYRSGFLKWINPIKSGPIIPEFTEMFYSSGKHPFNIAYNAYTLVQSVHVSSGREDDARQLFIQHIDDVSQDAQNVLANIHQSLNNPQHFLLYEVWSDFSHLIENELRNDRRSELETRFNELKDDALPEPAMELYQIYYDPDKYVHPTE